MMLQKRLFRAPMIIPKIDLEAKKDYFERAKKGDEKLVDEIFETLSSQYQPMEAIKGLKIYS
jgi:hypothetical protein